MSGHYVRTLCQHKGCYARTFGQYARKMSDVRTLFQALHVCTTVEGQLLSLSKKRPIQLHKYQMFYSYWQLKADQRLAITVHVAVLSFLYKCTPFATCSCTLNECSLKVYLAVRLQCSPQDTMHVGPTSLKYRISFEWEWVESKKALMWPHAPIQTMLSCQPWILAWGEPPS